VQNDDEAPLVGPGRMVVRGSTISFAELNEHGVINILNL
jgi:hypothetical protein